MMKVMVPIVRREDMGIEKFHRYWKEEHVEAVMGTPDTSPPIRRYVQLHPTPESYEEGDPDFDGAVVVWFDDLEAMET